MQNNVHIRKGTAMYKLYTFLFILCAAQVNAMDDTKTTFEDRIEDFNRQLEKHLAAHGNSDEFQIVQVHPEKYDFYYDRYTNSMLKALRSNASTTERCKARAKITDTIRYYPICLTGEQLLTKRLRRLFCVFTQQHPLAASDTYRFDDPYIMPVTPEFEQCTFFKEVNCCAGYVKQPNGHYQLHVCNNETGFPVLISPFTCKVKHPYSMADGTLFYATDQKETVQLDLNTHKANIIDPAKHKIRNLKALDKHSCYELYNKTAAIVNFATQKRWSINFAADDYTYKTVFTQDYLVLPTPEYFAVFDSNGNCSEIPHLNAASPLAVPSIATAKNIIAYQVTSPENGKRWVRCLELTPASKIAAAKEICAIPVRRNVKQLMFSSNAKRLFTLTDRSLRADAINKVRGEKFKWETPIDPSEIDNIYATDNCVYGYGPSGILYKFHPKFGIARSACPELLPKLKIVGDQTRNGIDLLFVKH